MADENKTLTLTAVLDGPNQWNDYYYWKVRADDGGEYKIRTKSADQGKLKIGESAEFKVYPPKKDGDDPFLSRQGFSGGGSGGGGYNDPHRDQRIARQSSYKVAVAIAEAAASAGKLSFDSVKDLTEKVQQISRTIENDVLNSGKDAPAPVPAPEPVAVAAAASDEIPF